MEQIKTDAKFKNTKDLYGLVDKNLSYSLLKVIHNIFFDITGLDSTYRIMAGKPTDVE